MKSQPLKKGPTLLCLFVSFVFSTIVLGKSPSKDKLDLDDSYDQSLGFGKKAVEPKTDKESVKSLPNAKKIRRAPKTQATGKAKPIKIKKEIFKWTI